METQLIMLFLKAEDLELLIGNYTEENMQTDVLRPYEARIYRIR